MVSHDRYFMDRLVEHIWVLGASREVRFFPGNYSQYRLAAADEKREAQAAQEANKANAESNVAPAPPKNDYSKRLSFKEKFEFEQLEGKMAELEQQKASLTEQLYANPDPSELKSLAKNCTKSRRHWKQRKTGGLNCPSAQSKRSIVGQNPLQTARRP